VQAADGTQVKLLPLALETVVEETPGLRRFQLIQTGPRALSLRLETEPHADAAMVWSAAEAQLRQYLAERGLVDIAIEHSSEAPRPNARGGKLRHVWSELSARSPAVLA
jgi:phenylacetate-coenzyme A ligase PaaK-like adenylate-forming protein